MWLAGGRRRGRPPRRRRHAARWCGGRRGMLAPLPRGSTVLALVAIVGYVLTQLAGPYIVRIAIDRGVVARRESVLWGAVAAYGVVALLNYVLARRQVRAVGALGEGFLRDLRVRLFTHLQRLGLGYHDRHPSGVIVSRLTSDVDSMQELVQLGLLMLVSNVLLVRPGAGAARRRVAAAGAVLPGVRAGARAGPRAGSSGPPTTRTLLVRTASAPCWPACRSRSTGYVSSRPTPASRWRSSASSAPTTSCSTPTWRRCGRSRGTCRRWRRAAWPPPRSRWASAAGWCCTT